MFTLIAMGTGVAWVYSAAATILPGLFPPAFRGEDGNVAVYFEAAAAITVLVLLGQVLELRAREHTGVAIRALLDLAPKSGRRILQDSGEEEISLEAIQIGDRLRVRPGEKMPRRRPSAGGQKRRRRIHGHGRSHAGHQGTRGEAHRRDT